MRIDATDVRAAASRCGWLCVLSALAGDVLAPALRRPGRHAPCPVHGGRHGDGFRLFADVDQTGGGICASCGAFPDGLALLQWLFRWSFPEALRQTAAVLGLRPGAAMTVVPARNRRQPPQRSVAESGQPREALRRAWAASLSPQHPGAWPLRHYLAARRLAVSVLDARVIRLHPALPYWSLDGDDQPHCLGRFPAMLARVCAADGRAVTLHRTYLRADGTGKAPVSSPKKLMRHVRSAPLAGGAVRLFPAGAALGIAEGIETALAVQAMTGLPVWACGSATLLARFRPPPCVERLTVWADKDRSEAGMRAAEVLHARLASVLEVHIELPVAPIPAGAKGLDWADVWLRQRRPTQPIAA
jgi:phage/plasmid primase-like uncharacterized protein